MFKVFAFGFETRNKTTSLLIYRFINEALLVFDHYFNQMPFQPVDIHVPRWFLINMFLGFGFSRCFQALVHWCGFHAARDESEWYIGLLLWCLAAQLKQLLPDICQAAGDFYFPVHHACTRAPSCCDTRLRTSHQT